MHAQSIRMKKKKLKNISLENVATERQNWIEINENWRSAKHSKVTFADSHPFE